MAAEPVGAVGRARGRGARSGPGERRRPAGRRRKRGPSLVPSPNLQDVHLLVELEPQQRVGLAQLRRNEIERHIPRAAPPSARPLPETTMILNSPESKHAKTTAGTRSSHSRGYFRGTGILSGITSDCPNRLTRHCATGVAGRSGRWRFGPGHWSRRGGSMSSGKGRSGRR